MKRKPKNIRVIAAKLTGGLHCAKRIPCQDFYQYACSGNKLVAVVSDGAGSAKYGKIGAKIVCEILVNTLINTPLKNVEEAVKQAIETARRRLLIHRLNRSKSEQEILNFSATVVGVFCHKKRGVFFHIGDGAGIALHNIEDYEDCTLSCPANGCFSCETFFYTMKNWREFLRFTKFEKAEALCLMTDGLTDFALSEKSHRLKKGFIEPIHRYLSVEPSKARALKALKNTLNAQKACRLNSDDKTFLWAGLS